MKRSIKFITFSLCLFCIPYNPVYAGIFKNNKDFEITKFLNFDIANYQFEDHAKILGKNSIAWNGEADQLPKDAVDTKEIKVIINGKSETLTLIQYKEKISLTLKFHSNITCKNAEEIVPKKYIKKENYYTYEHTNILFLLPFTKNTRTRFSIDNGSSRIHFSCLELFFLDSKSRTTIASISIQTKNNSEPKVVPIKSIICTLDKIIVKGDYKWNVVEPTQIIFHLLDSDSQILNQTFGILKHLKYDKNTIHTSEKKDYDNASEKKAQVLEREHIIDRLTGTILTKMKMYHPASSIQKASTSEATIKGTCEKMSVNRKV